MIHSRVAFAAIPILLMGTANAGTEVPLAHFASLQLRGGGHVILHHGGAQHVMLLKGSTKFTSFRLEGSQLVIDGCNWQCPHHYELEIDIVSPGIGAISVEGGGSIEAKGDFPHQAKLSAAVAGGGDVDARTIAAETVDAAVAGGGNIHVKPVRELHAAVTGGGDIAYSGDPHVTQAVVGGGSISHE